MVFEQAMRSLGLEPRQQQLSLVSHARSAMRENSVRLVQAGTGTGKSYAVLSVALEAARQSGMPSVVVCPNNSLIDQYVMKDVPTLEGVAGGVWAHIKGRSRYVCSKSFALWGRRDAQDEYRWLTRSGELEWANLGLDETYGCPGSDRCNPRDNCSCDEMPCECDPVCGAFEAKRRAALADVIVTNAHVLMWDYQVGVFSEGKAALLPESGALFVDECHELEGIGRQVLSTEIRQTNPIVKLISGLAHWFDDRTEELMDADKTEALLSRDEDIKAFAVEAETMAMKLMDKLVLTDDDKVLYGQLTRFVEFVTDESERFVSIIDSSDPENTVLRRVCVNAAPVFSYILTRQPTVLVSGTIPSSDRRRLGLPKTVELEDVGHPFDYGKSTLIVSRFNAREPRDLRGRVASAIRAVNQTGGGTMMLFTSWRDLDEVMPRVAQGLDSGIDVYVQSREDPTTLRQDIIDFKTDGNAVIAGVRSLFTGVDIPGPALRQIIMWKLPYQVPTIEVKAITDLFGRQVYRDQMLMVLTQGIGRLIRTKDDTGRVIIMDSRAKGLDWASNNMTYHLGEFS